MTEKLPDGWTTGELIGVAAPCQFVTLDCSGGESDIPDDQWCVGELIGVAAPFSTETLDCSHWEPGSVTPAEEPTTILRPPARDGVTATAPVEKPAG